MPNIRRTSKRLEVHCDASLADLRADQAMVVADRWINQNEPEAHLWEWIATYLSRDPDESWVVVYTQ